MGFDGHVLKAMISTPGDTGDEVAAIKEAVHEWNAHRAESEGVVVLPTHWGRDVVPLVTVDGGQAEINRQLVDAADILIVIFDSRLGQSTAVAPSGTAEELDRAAQAGKPVHVWFSNEPFPRNVDASEILRLQEFQKDLSRRALYGTYSDVGDLSSRVRRAIEADVRKLKLAGVAVAREAPSSTGTLEGSLVSKDLTFLDDILSDWRPSGQLFKTVSYRFGFNAYPAFVAYGIRDLAHRIRVDPRRVYSSKLSEPFENFTKATVEYARCISDYLAHYGPFDPSDKFDGIMQMYEVEKGRYVGIDSLVEADDRFRKSLTVLLGKIHDARP